MYNVMFMYKPQTHVIAFFGDTYYTVHSHNMQTHFIEFNTKKTVIHAAMWALARFLPLVIGHLIPEDDEHWENFLCLLDIMDILFAHNIASGACGYLEALIDDHHSTFLELYPHAPITMKMHSILHMPRLILE